MLTSNEIRISNTLLLKKATPDDLEFINEIIYTEMNSIVVEAWKNRFRWESWYKDMREAIEDETHLFFIIISSKEYVGSLWMNVEQTSLWITAIVLKKKWQRFKIGSQVLEYLIKKCKENGLQSIELGVQKNNSTALKFYTALGFEKFDHIASANTDLLRLRLTEPDRRFYS
jgi:ribosomal protein S18 acetylase RimI-like enzyme